MKSIFFFNVQLFFSSVLQDYDEWESAPKTFDNNLKLQLNKTSLSCLFTWKYPRWELVDYKKKLAAALGEQRRACTQQMGRKKIDYFPRDEIIAGKLLSSVDRKSNLPEKKNEWNFQNDFRGWKYLYLFSSVVCIFRYWIE